jgi:hypothetical protein
MKYPQWFTTEDPTKQIEIISFLNAIYSTSSMDELVSEISANYFLDMDKSAELVSIFQDIMRTKGDLLFLVSLFLSLKKSMLKIYFQVKRALTKHLGCSENCFHLNFLVF